MHPTLNLNLLIPIFIINHYLFTCDDLIKVAGAFIRKQMARRMKSFLKFLYASQRFLCLKTLWFILILILHHHFTLIEKQRLLSAFFFLLEKKLLETKIRFEYNTISITVTKYRYYNTQHGTTKAVLDHSIIILATTRRHSEWKKN